MFCTLAAWLITKAGHPFEQPQECDDPNAIISNVLSELRSFVSVEHAVFPSVFQARASPSDYVPKDWTDFSYLEVCTVLIS